ncbi:MAG: FAD:protein FMN transferase [Clostridia bacterium]|nr:FAD:protein FMN transferase [Clostridia bacterium]
MKRYLALCLMVLLLFAGCAPGRREEGSYTETYMDLFDTFTTIIGPGEDEEDFQKSADAIHDVLLTYHKLFDIYHDYPGVNNLKTVNDQAGIAPVAVDPVILELLADCREYYTLTGGRVNAAMGSVLSLWHDARNKGLDDPENARLPDAVALREAAKHMDWAVVELDEAASTVYITDSNTQLDVGAIAKGWAVEKAAQNAPAGFLISVGGNVRVTGPKAEDAPWVIGIQDPDQAGVNRYTIAVTSGSVVTSGDYQRTYVVDGMEYHHIIDPDTLMPAARWSSVTVICADSGLADALSTALFLLSPEEGKSLAEKCDAQALWVTPEGKEYMTDGFRALIRE